MRNRSVLAFIMISLGVTALMAADFWEKKIFTEWSDKQIQKILTDSPWARSTTVKVTGEGGGGPGGGRGGPMPGGMSFVPQRGGGGRGGGGGLEIPTISPQQQSIVRWQTALPIKQLAALARYGDEVETSPESIAFLNREEAEYIIGVIRVPSGLSGDDAEEIAAGAQLVIKNLPPIMATRAQVDREEGGTGVYLVFPKSEPGAHLITLEDKEVQVVVDSEAMKFKRKFSLKDMVYQGKLEM